MSNFAFCPEGQYKQKLSCQPLGREGRIRGFLSNSSISTFQIQRIGRLLFTKGQRRNMLTPVSILKPSPGSGHSGRGLPLGTHHTMIKKLQKGTEFLQLRIPCLIAQSPHYALQNGFLSSGPVCPCLYLAGDSSV